MMAANFGRQKLPLIASGILIVILSLVLYLSPTTATASETGTIKGKVTDTFTPKGHNLEGAVITAENKELLASEGGKRSITSDANGEYEIGNLPAGQYLVTTSKEGYIKYEDYVTVIARGETFHDVRMYVIGTQTPILKEFVAIPNPYVSSWLGTAKGVGTNLIIIFKEENPESPSSKVTMDIPAQNLKDIAVDKFERLYNSQPERIHIEVKSISLVYDGVNVIKLGFPKKFKGEMKLNGVTYTLMLEKEAQNPEPPNLPKHPQEPVKPYPYKEEEITYNSNGIEINGTLTYPNSKGPFPAVILLSDLGPQDRDGTVPGPTPQHPLLILADHLTRNGIAVLRTDDRQAGILVGDFYDSSFDNLAGDAIAGINYLKSRKEINSKKIGLISMGWGSSIALITANRSQDIKFVAMLNAFGLSAKEYMLSQLEITPEDQISEDTAIRIEFIKRLFALLDQEKDDKVVKKKIPDLYTDATIAISKKKLSPEEEKAMRTSSGSQYQDMVNSYQRSFFTYDPKQDFMKLKLPLLIVISEENWGVVNEKNYTVIEESLKNGGNKNYTLKEIPNPNQAEETIPQTALKFISDWILGQTK
ncbi:MAG: carboxypeptidase regulatory-like domain-containing protein [Candidatus Poribacteria bacterium]|mgnify:CR=1 FL=1